MRHHTSKLMKEGICSIHETLAAELLAEYEEQLLSGKWPDLDEYVRRYAGPEPAAFRLELQLAAVLLYAGAQSRGGMSPAREWHPSGCPYKARRDRPGDR